MKLLHVMNGDASADRLRQARTEGKILVYSELLHEGPVPDGLEGEEWRRVRARHFAARGWCGYEEFLVRQRQLDKKLESFLDFDEVILWFEHDLYDQLLLIRHLDWFGRRDRKGTRLSLICIDRFPGHEPFHGLGQLSPKEHASLLGQRQPVGSSQIDLASKAWQAFRSPDPVLLEQLAADGTPGLPFLEPALRRHLQEFPSVGQGLSRNQSQILKALQQGASTPLQLFRRCSEMEESPYLGDTTFFSYLGDLACATHPALSACKGDFVRPRGQPSPEFLDQPLQLSSLGRDVLAGRTDYVELNGIDRWLGGVHLNDSATLWRWDRERQKLLPGTAKSRREG